MPLLKLFKEHNGDWVIDKELLGRLVRTLRDTERPAILYLFSTHFGQGAPIEAALAADPANLSWTAEGPLPKGTFYGADIYNWSLAGTRTAITARRVQAAQAVLREICKLEPRHVEKIRGITLLGELHHLFPNYEASMGFVPPYLVSDYSEVSKAGFRRFLERHFGTIATLNANIGTSWTSFQQVEPPSKDVRITPLRDFTEHIDSFAHGSLPISGWAYVQRAADLAPSMVRIYRNGDLIAQGARQHGAPGRPECPAGIGQCQHRLALRPGFQDVAHRVASHRRLPGESIGRPDPSCDTQHRHTGQEPANTAGHCLKRRCRRAAWQTHRCKASVDMPADQSSYFYNPLVTYWHAFRALQVADYLRSFEKGLQAPCVAQTKRYTHQILPFAHPAWDETKFAVDASLRKLDGIGLGVSLYGEPTYGTTFFSWLESSPHKHYGVTEFHPLKAMDPMELEGMLARHAGHGVEFVSFFLEPRWKGRLVPRAHNLFSLDPDNPKFGSQQLYESVRSLLRADTD